MNRTPSGVAARLGFLAAPAPMTRAQRLAAARIALDNAEFAARKHNASGAVKHLGAAAAVLPRRGTPGTNGLWARHDSIQAEAEAI